MENLSQYNINRKNVLCFCVPDKMDVKDDGVTLVLVTNDGYLVEIIEEVTNKFSLKHPIENINKISIFYSYEPKFKYYILSVEPDLLIFKKNVKLTLHRKFSNVRDFNINDAYNTGKPQVVINFIDKNQVITDFSDNSKNENPCFVSETKKMDLRIKRLEKLLTDKKSVISKMTLSSINVEQYESYTNLVCGFGSNSFSDIPKNTHLLKIGQGGYKILYKKLIIYFPIINNNKEPINNLEIYIAHQTIIIKNTILYIKSSNNFVKASILNPSSDGYLIAVLEEPLFFETRIKLMCVLKYKINNKDCQFYLKEIIVDLKHVENKFLCKETEDILALKSVSYEVKLYLKKSNDEDVTQALESLKFKRISTCLYLNNSNFKNCLIYVLSGNYIFYTEDQNQFLILFQSLKKLLGGVCFTDELIDAQNCIQALQNELGFLKKILFEQINETSEASPQAQDVLKKLSHLEIESIKAFAKT